MANTPNKTWIRTLGYKEAEKAINGTIESFEYDQASFVDIVLHDTTKSIPNNMLPTFRAGIKKFWSETKKDHDFNRGIIR